MRTTKWSDTKTISIITSSKLEGTVTDLELLCKRSSLLWDINLNGELDFIYGQKENN